MIRAFPRNPRPVLFLVVVDIRDGRPHVLVGPPSSRRSLTAWNGEKFVASSALASVGLFSASALAFPKPAAAEPPSPMRAGPRKILIAGGGFPAPVSIRATWRSSRARRRPRLCYLPTASADRPAGTASWYQSCATLNVEAFEQDMFISSYRQDKSWDEVLLSMDGIVASGGNTLNQQAIWKAQGIDEVLAQGAGCRHCARRRERGLALLVRRGNE